MHNNEASNVQLFNAKPRKVELDGGFFSSAPYEACRVCTRKNRHTGETFRVFA